MPAPVIPVWTTEPAVTELRMDTTAAAHQGLEEHSVNKPVSLIIQETGLNI